MQARKPRLREGRSPPEVTSWRAAGSIPAERESSGPRPAPSASSAHARAQDAPAKSPAPRAAAGLGQNGRPEGPQAPTSESTGGRARAGDAGTAGGSRGLPGHRGQEKSAPPNRPTPRLTRLAATPGGLKRNSPARTPHPKAGSLGARAGGLRATKCPAPSAADPARPAPAARVLWGACATWLDGPTFGRREGEGE